MLSASEHLAFCKKQALQVLVVNLIGDAWANFVKNLNLHPETKMSPSKFLVSMMVVEAVGFSKEQMKKYIEGYDPNGIGLSRSTDTASV
ncbi:MAG: hypothetical protein Q7R59_02560 [bacterium]|nr:hypothetical protein [bacterium]